MTSETAIETVNVTSETEHWPGQPRSERDAAFLERFDARMRLPIIVSAPVTCGAGWCGLAGYQSGYWVGPLRYLRPEGVVHRNQPRDPACSRCQPGACLSRWLCLAYRSALA